MNYSVNLNITPGGMPPVLHMSQYDTGRTYAVTIKDADGSNVGLGTNPTAKVKGFNGKNCFEIDATVANSVVTFTLTDAATDQYGIFPVTIELTVDGQDIISPLCMIFDVQKAGYTNEQAASSPEFENAMQEAAQKYVLGMDEAARIALLDLLAYAAYTGPDAQAKYDALETALRAKLSYIVADYVQDRTVYDTDSLDFLKEGDDLIVTAYYDDGTHIDLADSQYTLSGTLTAGTSTITATYGGKTATFTVTVTHADVPREYTAYDYIAYTGSDVTDANAENNVHTAVYADLNAYVIEFDFSPLVAKTTATAICGGQYGTGNTKNVTFYARTDTHRVSVFSHGTAIGIDNNTNVAVGSVAHVKLDPGSASPSTLSVDEASQTGAWTNTDAVNAPIGYCGGIRQDNAKLNVYKFAGIGILTLKDLSGTLVGKYIPVKRNADNVMGIYDSVEGVFHTASNTALVTQGNANCIWEVGNWS